jgi:hypothetical protein
MQSPVGKDIGGWKTIAKAECTGERENFTVNRILRVWGGAWTGFFVQRPPQAADRRKASEPMDVILHVGAHRTATTCFQNYLRENRETLFARGIGVLCPPRTRAGLFRGVLPVPVADEPQAQLDRARGRIAIQIEKAAASGLRQLVVSDENMLGAPRNNLREARLYADAGQRMARFAYAFGVVSPRVVLSIRQQEMFWASSLAFGVARGHRLPRERDLRHMARGRRGWRDVIEDIACAVESATPVAVMPYEVFGGRCAARLEVMTGQTTLPSAHACEWRNKSPRLAQLRQVLRDRGIDPARLPKGEGRWMPFTNDQVAALQEAYQDDLFWLTGGADGLAQLTEETGSAEAGQKPNADETTRGLGNGIEERRMA